MRTAVESYSTYATRSSESNMMRDFNVVMNEVETFDEREVIRQLTEDGFHGRVEVIERLRAAVRVHQRLPFSNTIGLFQALDHALSDTNWDVRRQCITLISDYIPHLRSDVDACMSLILPRLIFNIGDGRIVIRRGVIQTLHTYMKHTNDMPLLMRYYIEYGFQNVDPKVRKEATVALPMLITSDFASEDFTDIIASLCKKLVDRDEDEHVQSLALSTLNKVRVCIGDAKFKSYLLKLQPQLREYYCNIADFHFDSPQSSGSVHPYNGNHQIANSQSPSVSELYYGVVPPLVMNQLSDDNFRNRGQAIEQLKLILENLHSINPLLPHIKEFLAMLNTLLEDNNFRIITITLDIIGILVEKTSQEIRPHLKPVLQTLTKRMGDNKNLVRQAITKVITQLMQILGPKLVLLMLCDNLSHRSPRVRSEAINCIINALLTFPSYEFDLPSLCSSMAYCLLDSKRNVRHASLECFAVLAQCLGAGKLQPLTAAVDNLEQSYGKDSEGVKSAVQARLTRRALPRRNEDNLIEYAVQLPSLNASRNGSLGHQGADVDWILAGTGAAGTSARSMRLEDLESSSRQSSASIDGRRHLSAGIKSRLPWDEAQSPKASESPVKAKQTWADEPASDTPLKKPGKGSRQREDLLLASINYSTSNSPTQPELLSVEGGNRSLASSPAAGKPPPPFNKSLKPEVSSSKPHKHTSKQALASDLSGQGNKSISGKPILNPLPVDSSTGSVIALANQTWGYEGSTTPTKVASQSSIPVKSDSIGRKSGSKKPPSKVPPISKSHSPTSAGDDVTEGGTEELPQLNASLNKIRNSASKKKLNKLFEKLEKQESSVQQSPASSISGQSPSKGENPFEAKPMLARHNSQAKSKPKTNSDVGRSGAEKIPAVQPLSGLKDSDLRLVKSDSLVSKIKQSSSRSSVGSTSHTTAEQEDPVAVFGRGYSDDHTDTPPKQSSVKRTRPQKANTGNSLSPLGVSASSAPGMIPLDDDSELVTVIGKGVFDGDSVKERERSNSINRRTDRSNSLSKSMSSGYGTLKEQISEFSKESDEEVDSLQMSKGLKERAQLKKKERQEEAAAARRLLKEKEEALQAAEEQRRLEQEQEQKRKRREQQEAAAERRRELAERRKHEETNADFNPELIIAGNAPGKSSSSTSATDPARSRTRSPVLSAHSQYAPIEEELRPFTKPSVVFKDAMRLIADSDWSNKIEAMTKIRRLAHHHTDVLMASVHSVTLALISEVQNLRSQVARYAIITLADMFSTLKRSMDPELETCAKVLLQKNGESNEFIRAELEKTLSAMVSDSTPQRCLAAFIAGGSQHKIVQVRKVTAQHMSALCDKLGPGKLLSGVKDLTDKVIPALAVMCRDPSQQARWYARKILLSISEHPEFESMLAKYTTSTDFREVKQIVENLRLKGLGGIPNDTPSATGARRTGTMTRGSRTNSAESNVSGASSVVSRKSAVSAQASEEATQLIKKMSSTQWSERNKSISDLVEVVHHRPKVLAAQPIKIFDKYAMLVKDSNSKVALHALDTLASILVDVKQEISLASLTLLVQNTAAGLASKNAEMYKKASNLLDAFINNLDHVLLFHPFVQVTVNATAKTKPDIIDRVSYLAKKVYSAKPKQVTLHGLPLAWNLVRSLSTTGSTAVLREAVADYIKNLYGLMGPGLFEYCSSAPDSNPQLVAMVRELSGA